MGLNRKVLASILDERLFYTSYVASGCQPAVRKLTRDLLVRISVGQRHSVRSLPRVERSLRLSLTLVSALE